MKQGCLKDILTRRSIKLTWMQRIRLLSSVTVGMSYLHTHRRQPLSTKTSNLLIDENWNVKVTGFGFARVKRGESHHEQMQMRTTQLDWCVSVRIDHTHSLPILLLSSSSKCIHHLALVHWPAPEVIKGEKCTEKVGIYSFGHHHVGSPHTKVRSPPPPLSPSTFECLPVVTH